MLIAKARLGLIELFYGPKRLSLIIVAAVELGLSSMPGYKASAAPPAIPSEFILRVKALADSGQLTEPEKVGRLLHLNLIFNRHFSSTASERDCAPPGDKNRSQEEDIYAAEGLKLAPAVGEPIRSEITWCSGLHASNPTVSARIQFGDLDRFVCISEDDLKSTLPTLEKEPRPGTYYYRGKLTEEYGVIAIFVLRTKCAIGATLEQSERFGTRGQRVIAKIEGCRRKLQADQPFKPYDPADCGTYQTLIGTE